MSAASQGDTPDGTGIIERADRHDGDATWSCRIALPPGYRERDVLAFNRRDPLAVAECVDGRTLRKGIAWQGLGACLTIRFEAGRVDATLAVDGGSAATAGQFEPMVRRMLGLTQRIDVFEHAYRDHPQIGPLIAKRPGLRVSLSASPFEALTWAITGQQISVRAAISMRRKLIVVAGLKHSSGLTCYPDAARIAALSEQALRDAGFSRTKAQTLIALSRLVEDGGLPFDAWLTTLPLPVDEIRARLMQVRGIGPWTIDYALLRGFGWLDGSLHGDVAVRRSLQTVLVRADKVGEKEARCWLADFSPWRALVAAHLWAMQAFDG